MTAAVADQIWPLSTTGKTAATARTPKPRRVSAAKVAPPAEYVEMAQQVSTDLSRIALDEQRRTEIARQIHMLEGELKKRAERLAAMEDAVVQQRVMEARRARGRAHIAQKLGMIGSGMLAAMFTGMIVISIL